METDASISLEPPHVIYIYIQALYRLESGGEQIVSKWYKIPGPGPSGKFLAPVFDGPRNGLGLCASVASGSTIYLIGGVVNSKLLTEEHCDLVPKDILTNRVYFRDVVSDCGWKEGPSMIKHRAGHHAALVNGKIYVFGSTIRIWEEDAGGLPWAIQYQWSLWAEFLDLSECSSCNWKWNHMPNPPGLRDQDVAIGHASLDHGKFFLVYCKHTDELQIYDTERQRWESKPSDGCYHVVTFMDGILYGAAHVDWGFETIYALKIKKFDQDDHKPVKGLEMIRGPILPSGLIPLGQDVLCVLTGYRSTSDNVFKIYCSKYRISKSGQGETDKQTGGPSVTAQLLSRSNYYLKDVISVESCLLM